MAVSLTKKAGMEVAGSFILGLPGEDYDGFSEIMKFAMELDLDYAQFQGMIALTGTTLYEAHGLAKNLESFMLTRWMNLVDELTEELSAGQIWRKFWRGYVKYYLGARFIGSPLPSPLPAGEGADLLMLLSAPKPRKVETLSPLIAAIDKLQKETSGINSRRDR